LEPVRSTEPSNDFVASARPRRRLLKADQGLPRALRHLPIRDHLEVGIRYGAETMRAGLLGGSFALTYAADGGQQPLGGCRIRQAKSEAEIATDSSSIVESSC
jgi:hypothetical protein